MLLLLASLAAARDLPCALPDTLNSQLALLSYRTLSQPLKTTIDLTTFRATRNDTVITIERIDPFGQREGSSPFVSLTLRPNGTMLIGEKLSADGTVQPFDAWQCDVLQTFTPLLLADWR